MEDNTGNFINCFICTAPSIGDSARSRRHVNGAPVLDVDIDNQLRFLLQNILELRKGYLEQFLREQQSDPQGMLPKEWRNLLCDTCWQTIANASRIYQEIVNAARTYRKIKKQIVENVQRSSDPQMHKGEWRMINNYVNMHEYGAFMNCLSNPFLETELEKNENLLALDFRNASNSVVDYKIAGATTEEFFEADPLSFDQSLGTAVKSEVSQQEYYNESLDSSNFMNFENGLQEEVKIEPGIVQVLINPNPEDHLQLSENTNQTTPKTKKSRGTKRKRKPAKFQISPDVEHGPVEIPGVKRTSSGPVTCKCGNRYTAFPNFSRHLKDMELRQSGGGYTCQICLQGIPSKVVTFRRKDNLKSHVQNKHGGKETPCPDCGKILRWAPSLAAHRAKCRGKLAGAGRLT